MANQVGPQGDPSKTLVKNLSLATITRMHQSSWRAQQGGMHKVGDDELRGITDVLLYKRFKILFICMKVMGLFFLRSKNIPSNARWIDKVRHWTLLQFYCIFMCFLLFMNFIRSLTTFKSNEAFDTRTFFKILACIFSYESASRAVLSYWACQAQKQGIQSLFISIDTICYSDQIIPYEGTIRSRLKFMLAISILVSLTNTGTMAFGFFGTDDLRDLYQVHLRPFPLEEGTIALFAFEAFYLAITFVNAMVAMLTLSFYVVVCSVLHQEFQYLCRTFAMKIRDDGRFTDDLEKFRLQHERRCQLVKDADAIFKYYIANTYLTNVPQLCLLLYMIVYSDDAFGSRVINSFKLAYVLIQMLGVSVAATLINTELFVFATIPRNLECKRCNDANQCTRKQMSLYYQAHALLGRIYKISSKATTYDTQTQVSLHMFLNRMTGTSIGLSPWDIFVINKGSMLTRCLFFVPCCFVLVTFSVFFTFHTQKYLRREDHTRRIPPSNKVHLNEDKSELHVSKIDEDLSGRGSIHGFLKTEYPNHEGETWMTGKERRLAVVSEDSFETSPVVDNGKSDHIDTLSQDSSSARIDTQVTEKTFIDKSYHQEIARDPALPPKTQSSATVDEINTALPMKADQVVVNMTGLPYRKPKRPVVHNQVWQVVDGPRKAYLLSAYYDDRPALDAPKIRIIGIFEPNISTPHCLLWYHVHNQTNPDVVMGELIQIGPNINPVTATKYGQFILSCAIAQGKTPPLFVSVVTPDSHNATTLLLVQWPVKSAEPIEFGQCMSVVYWGQDPFRVVEWMELQKLLGVGEVTLYNNSLDAMSSMIVNHYATVEHYVVVKQSPSVLDDDGELTILMNMSPAINDCLYRNMYRYKWVLSSDLDEVIMPTTYDNYTAMVNALVEKHAPSKEVMSFMFKNVYFFDDLGPVRRKPWYLWTMRYLRHIPPSPYGYAVKSFSNPLACVGLQNHLCWKRVPSYQNATTWNIDVGLHYGKNQHYKKCHFDTFLERNGVCHKVMRRYKQETNILRLKDKLNENVVAKLLELDLIEKA
ncbi:hypothetical protein CAPTEDRAFT_200201 [Capitella teleta]|uniref:Glycosyltransferase family 92 protein n=1 Tax=Capitella teleta TaxID=283909 RepID=R7UWX7_CAPTE|nr:hypothetical protein CAPTEDRAFT_200201 [Capitella teleta]|eukprot:ELU10767.1 hypothetical protein CAPTEDRAFT_200201 [Capitella teleta]